MKAFIIIVLVCACIIKLHYFSHTNQSNTAIIESNAPDAFITTLSVRAFDENGLLVHELQTPKLDHLPKNNIHRINTPYIRITKANQPLIELHAHQAISQKNGQTILFEHDVHITSTPKNPSDKTELNTEELFYLPKEQRATTEKPVEMVQKDTHIQSTGLNAYLDDHRLQLLNKTKGTYHAPPRA